jgi:hypothetical protein
MNRAAIHPELKATDRVTIVCGKCSGTGVYAGPSGVVFFTKTIQDTTTGCFDCNGTGGRSLLVSSLRAAARRAEKRAERAAEQESQREANWAASAAAERNEAHDKALLEQVRRDALKPVPEGRQEITGTVLGIKIRDGYMPGQTTLKLLLDCDGFKLWGTFPNSLCGTQEVDEETLRTFYTAGAEVGDQVTMTATVAASADLGFGFYSRPAKATFQKA